MLNRIKDYFRIQQAYQRVNLALNRAGVIATLNKIDLTNPASWEFSGFSQNGEDGIIELLCTQLKHQDKTFLEIGSADGLENNTAWLGVARKYSGIMVEGSQPLSDFSKKIMARLNLGVQCVNEMITKENAHHLLAQLPSLEPDVFSIDIDGNDYYITQLLMQKGLRPKIIAVEYNSAFGPEQPLTVSYQQGDAISIHESGLYYGVSIQAWQRYFASQNYRFISVDTRGVNAFFVRPDCFDSAFLDGIKPLAFKENFFQRQTFKEDWQKQFERIKHLEYRQVA